MGTIFEQSNKDVVDRLMSDAVWRNIIIDYMMLMNDGFYPQHDIDFVTQPFRRDEYNIYDAYVFAKIHTMISNGEMYGCYLDVGRWPFADRAVDEHNKVLAKLPTPFYGKCWSGTQGADGYIGWDSTVAMDNPKVAPGIESRYENVKKRHIPLEIGFQSAPKTYMQLVIKGGLARWCYGSTHIQIWMIDPKTQLAIHHEANQFDDA